MLGRRTDKEGGEAGSTQGPTSGTGLNNLKIPASFLDDCAKFVTYHNAKLII